MENSGKDSRLEAAIWIGKLYAALARSLRAIIDPEINEGISEALFVGQLDRIWTELTPILSKNHIVQKNVSGVSERVTKICEAAADEASRNRAIEDAKDYLPIIEERARTVSDLVALFRRL